jgi:hypothetical protein
MSRLVVMKIITRRGMDARLALLLSWARRPPYPARVAAIFSRQGTGGRLL